MKSIHFILRAFLTLPFHDCDLSQQSSFLSCFKTYEAFIFTRLSSVCICGNLATAILCLPISSRYFPVCVQLSASSSPSSHRRRFSGTVTSSTQLLSAMNAAVLPHLGQTRHGVTLSCSAWLLRGGSSATTLNLSINLGRLLPKWFCCSWNYKKKKQRKKKRERWKFNESQLRATTAKQYTLFSVATCV